VCAPHSVLSTRYRRVLDQLLLCSVLESKPFREIDLYLRQPVCHRRWCSRGSECRLEQIEVSRIRSDFDEETLAIGPSPAARARQGEQLHRAVIHEAARLLRVTE